MNRDKSMQRNNTSGVTGVTFNKNADKWQAKIGVGRGVVRHLGYFGSIEEAVSARLKAQSELGYAPAHGMKNRAPVDFLTGAPAARLCPKCNAPLDT